MILLRVSSQTGSSLIPKKPFRNSFKLPLTNISNNVDFRLIYGRLKKLKFYTNINNKNNQIYIYKNNKYYNTCEFLVL